jgi:outer membrane protein OmpA-like peptidoglycan-associated protein
MSEEQSPIGNQTSAEPLAARKSPVAAFAPKLVMTPAVMLAVLIIVLLGVLIFMVLRNGMYQPTADPAEITELQAQANALRSQLNRERMALGLRPLEGGSEPMEDIAARLKKDADTMVALAGSFQSLLGEKDLELTAKSAELLRSEQLRQSLAAEATRLQGELQRALVNNSELDLLRRDLTTMKAQRDALASELDATRKELAAKGQGVSKDDMADLQRRFEETLRAKEFFEAKVKELQGDLSKAKLFANSENELLPAAVELCRKLRKLENMPEAEIATAYSSLGAQLGANVLHKFNFATGSSGLSAADQETIRNMVADIPDGDLVLAIGYASETGNVDHNRTLSSDRATAVARLYESVKRPAQLVQAVYLGQTDRFSSKTPEANQLVEIWRIRKQ